MAQDFESNGKRITNSATTIFTADSDDAVVGLRFANILTTTDTLDVFITDAGDSNNTRYLIKGDVLKAQSGTANGFDCWVSRVDAIS